MYGEELIKQLILSKKDIEALEGRMLQGEKLDIKYVHTFAPGIYIREAHFPKDSYIIGHEHKSTHLNILLKGRLRLLADGHAIELVAPLVLKADAGVRKVAHVLEDAIWANVLPNPTGEEDPDKLEDIFVVKSETFKAHELALKNGSKKGELN